MTAFLFLAESRSALQLGDLSQQQREANYDRDWLFSNPSPVPISSHAKNEMVTH